MFDGCNNRLLIDYIDYNVGNNNKKYKLSDLIGYKKFYDDFYDTQRICFEGGCYHNDIVGGPCSGEYEVAHTKTIKGLSSVIFFIKPQYPFYVSIIRNLLYIN